MIDCIITNAHIRTLHSQRPHARAIAIAGDRIAAIGTNEEILLLAGPRTRLIDAADRLMLPGFNDAHVHYLTGGFQLAQVNLRPARSPQKFTDILHHFARRTPPGQWITGGQWDHEAWPGAALPTKEWLDPVTPDHPVFVHRLDLHMAVANSVTLRLAGITRHTPDPDGGTILRDPATGEPTGLLKDAAMNAVTAIIPPPTFEEKLAAARAATDHANRLGVTSVHDMHPGVDLAVWQELHHRGELKTRIYSAWPISRWETLAAPGLHAGFGSDWLRVGLLKAFCDGSLGSGTALFFDPYIDDPANRGLPADEMSPPGAMLQRALAADRAGLQLAIHAIGDAANDQVLSLYEELQRMHGPRDRRSRIEHAQHLRPQDLPRFARASVIASVQPYHAIDDGRWAEKRIGRARCATTYPFRSLLDAGATLALGTDWPVAPLDPFATLAAAVTRQTLEGAHPGGWFPEQRLTIEQAVRAYTVGSAYAEFQDHVKGTLTPGKLADLILLDRDLFTCAPADIASTKVELTMVGGRIFANGADT